MNQIKTGKFIADCRKKENQTQMQLAEKLNITDRAISKWETGRAMPDSSIMLELCSVLKISVNDLLSGEKATMENYDKELENKLIEMIKQKEESDRRLLTLEWVIAILSILVLMIPIIIGSFMEIEEYPSIKHKPESEKFEILITLVSNFNFKTGKDFSCKKSLMLFNKNQLKNKEENYHEI